MKRQRPDGTYEDLGPGGGRPRGFELKGMPRGRNHGRKAPKWAPVEGAHLARRGT